MNLDIRLPIGMMFTLIGAMLAISGFLTKADTAMYQCSLGININLIWGAVLLVFGLIMLSLALLNREPEPAAGEPAAEEAALK